MSRDILIACGQLSELERSEGDVTALPNYFPYGDATLISELDWIALIKEFGSERALVETLGVIEDLRQVD